MVDVVDARSTVASPSAAGGGYSEGAASAAVGEGRSRSVGKDIRRITANGGDISCRRQPPYKEVASGNKEKQYTPAGVMEW